MLLSRDCTHFGCIGKATSLSVLGGTPWEQESKAFRQPKGDNGAELENGDRNTDVKKEDANGADGKRRERMPEEKRRRTSRRAGNASATTNPSIGSTTVTALFSLSVFSAVPDMVPYPAGASANMERQVGPDPQANESRETLHSID
jgi:hypothetical protein